MGKENFLEINALERVLRTWGGRQGSFFGLGLSAGVSRLPLTYESTGSRYLNTFSVVYRLVITFIFGALPIGGSPFERHAHC
jgi:hypothetical protein